MKKILYIAALFAAFACTPAEQGDRIPDNQVDGYVFHDDFYYTGSSDMPRVFLQPISDEHYVVFDSRYLEDVLASLNEMRFSMISGPQETYYNSVNEDFIVPDSMKKCMSVRIKGTGEIANIPHVVYSNHLYLNHIGSVEGDSNTLNVYLGEYNDDSHYSSVFKFAENLGLVPYDYWPELKVMFLACTNASCGNPAEIANWFCEETDYLASPNWGSGNWN